mmetsp:Transcript_51666/g.112337  ORF Transcript_51666/g.112337 Transcript_51666/m.112337 type:complete len:98 (-) Transcript_51666:729-1022(-)
MTAGSNSSPLAEWCATGVQCSCAAWCNCWPRLSGLYTRMRGDDLVPKLSAPPPRTHSDTRKVLDSSGAPSVCRQGHEGRRLDEMLTFGRHFGYPLPL